ncbi:MAG TPA: DUF3422 domain-containing protein [Geopsychrobacteraceae bacterium]|nr:DUF3422 domain-containing protein [Geopsychrobacteraceae bacterium]
MTKFANIDCKSHPLREALNNELHTRPFYAVSTPQQFSYLAITAHHTEQEEAFELLRQLCQSYNVREPEAKSSGFRENFGQFTLKWERHVEFYSILVMRPFLSKGDPFENPAIEILPGEWLARLPGEVVAAFHMALVDAEFPAEEEDLFRYFEGERLSISKTKQGKATLHNAFRLHKDGFGRLLIRNHGMSDAQMGRQLRRLIEVETYRLLAVMALPLAKQIVPQLVEMDQQLGDFLTQVPQTSTGADERDLLQKLSKLEARLETWRTQTNRLFSGAKAYHEMLQDRLAIIGEEKVDGYTTLGEFIQRRLDPALRTCASVHTWMDDLSQRIKRASDLLRTRVNLTLQEQNRGLLTAMNRRSRLQFRLQETVEGLSVVAISYYLVSLIKYLIYALPLEESGLSKPVLLAASVPLVLGYVLWLTRRIKQRLIKAPDQQVEEE